MEVSAGAYIDGTRRAQGQRLGRPGKRGDPRAPVVDGVPGVLYPRGPSRRQLLPVVPRPRPAAPPGHGSPLRLQPRDRRPGRRAGPGRAKSARSGMLAGRTRCRPRGRRFAPAPPGPAQRGSPLRHPGEVSARRDRRRGRRPRRRADGDVRRIVRLLLQGGVGRRPRLHPRLGLPRRRGAGSGRGGRRRPPVDQRPARPQGGRRARPDLPAGRRVRPGSLVRRKCGRGRTSDFGRS